MRVAIRLFAQLRELTGHSELRRDLGNDDTVEAAWRALASEFPAVAAHERSVSAAVNGDYARFTTRLHEDDEVAFLPPVSGGSEELQIS